MENTKKITWYTLAFMAFSTVWGFGNVLNGFVYFNGSTGYFQLDPDVRTVFCALCPYGRRAGICF